MEFKYLVNKEEKTVVCVIEEEEELRAVADDLRRATVTFIPRVEGWSVEDVQDLLKKYDYHLTKSVGKAVCMPQDTFDEKTGSRIARTRALNKFYHKRNSIIEIAVRELNWELCQVRWKIHPDAMYL